MPQSIIDFAFVDIQSNNGGLIGKCKFCTLKTQKIKASNKSKFNFVRHVKTAHKYWYEQFEKQKTVKVNNEHEKIDSPDSVINEQLDKQSDEDKNAPSSSPKKNSPLIIDTHISVIQQ